MFAVSRRYGSLLWLVYSERQVGLRDAGFIAVLLSERRIVIYDYFQR